MRTITKDISNSEYAQLLNYESFSLNGLYIDIETTGFRRDHDMIYLVGLIYSTTDSLMLQQFLCESTADEYELLYTLNQRLESFDTLIHFNGQRFDIPFIKARMALFNIKETLSDKKSIDLYPLLRPYKKLLGTDNLKLSSLEALAGYDRVDPFTGGDLIFLFKKYLEGDQKIEPTLLLHNEEDMVGLYYLNRFLPLLCLSSSSSASLLTQEIFHQLYNTEEVELIHHGEQWLCSLPFKQPLDCIPFSHATLKGSFSLDNQGLLLSLPVLTTTKKHFLEDYSNYYYLTEQDTSVHKSLAEHIPSSKRKKATSKTAYIKKEDTYVQCPLSYAWMQSLLNSLESVQQPLVFTDTLKSQTCYLKLPVIKQHINPLILPLIQAIIE
jgi:uncharacterized protein YprB with RNaseH-like and TPR domain